MGILQYILNVIFHRHRPIPTPTPTPNPTPTPTPVPGDVVAQLLQFHNTARGAANPLRLDAKLEVAATKHAQWMAVRGNMSHNEGFKNVGERVTEAGYRWNLVGENIAEGQADVQTVFTAWMRSPGHHANIMNKGFTDAGFAMIRDAHGVPYWCADFGHQG